MQIEEALSLLLPRIHSLHIKGRPALVAVDGMAASGKTTLCQALCAALPGSFVVHMDDFTVPLDLRHPGYFEETLSNADVARFEREVLAPLRAGKRAAYRPYRCHPTPGFLPDIVVPQDASVVIVEGAYCLHEKLFDRYDLRALMLVDPDAQRERILRRNGEAQLERFLITWIPMENRHLAARALRSRCDIVLE